MVMLAYANKRNSEVSACRGSSVSKPSGIFAEVEVIGGLDQNGGHFLFGDVLYQDLSLALGGLYPFLEHLLLLDLLGRPPIQVLLSDTQYYGLLLLLLLQEPAMLSN